MLAGPVTHGFPLKPNTKEAILEIVGSEATGVPTEEICRRLQATPQELGDSFEALRAGAKLQGFAGLWFTPANFQAGTERFLAALKAAHAETPSRVGIPSMEVAEAAGLTWKGKPLDRIVADLATRGLVTISGDEVREASFAPDLPARQQRFLERVIEAIDAETINVPTPHDIARLLGSPHQAVEEILRIGVQAGVVVNIGEGIFYTPLQIEALRTRVLELVGGRPFSQTELRDALSSSRRYVTPLLEYFDNTGFTDRVGNRRTVRS